MPTERRRVFYAGRVQGVGFRFTAQRLAEGFPVSGFVRNSPDGRVELLVEGEPESIDSLLRAIRDEMRDKIRSVSSANESPGDPPYSEFSIRF